MSQERSLLGQGRNWLGYHTCCCCCLDLDDGFEAAEKFRQMQEWKGTLVVDGMDNAAQKAYGSYPGGSMCPTNNALLISFLLSSDAERSAPCAVCMLVG